MLTRSVYLAAGWFIISFIGLLLGGRQVRPRSWVVSLGWLSFVILIGDAWAILTFGIPWEILVLSGLAGAFGVFIIIWLRSWNPFGQVLWAMSLLTGFLFIGYAFSVTALSPLNPLSYLIAMVFFFVEAFALLLALTHTYESLEATTRTRWRRRVDRPFYPIPGYMPKVSFHVPTHNEPPEVVRRTLHSLARLDYPNYEVVVVDNNTPEERVWRDLEGLVRSLGPRFRYVHLDQWPGYKSGALNFALTQTARDAEIIGIVDADYELQPNFLRDLTPGFYDPNVAFIQTPQDYRDYQGHPFTEATYYGYKYFFEVSMPVRNEHNASIIAGTMGLIRKSALQEIGGWDEWCITEDAEASLRILKLGYQSIFVDRIYGQGLMPFTFDGLKKQRFRWCFGGIQILRKHWEGLMPWARWVDPSNRLTPAQRYFYLAGGLQWYTDVLNLFFALFLILGALFSYFDVKNVIRPLTGPLLILPGIFLFLNIWRFLWVLRHKLHLSWRKALISMYNFFSMGWVVSLASIQGLFQSQGVFLRTPKAKSKARFWRAIEATRWEAGIGVTCVAAGVLAFLDRPDALTFLLAALLFWQGSLYLAAPAYSLLSLGVPGPEQRGAPARRTIAESWAARSALALVFALASIVLIIQFLPRPAGPPSYILRQPPSVPVGRLLGLNPAPIEARDDTPMPSPTAPPLPATPTEARAMTGSATPSLAPTGVPSSTPAPTATASASPIPTATATATQIASPTPTSTATAAATQIASPSPTPSPTQPATSTPAPGTATVTAAPTEAVSPTP